MSMSDNEVDAVTVGYTVVGPLPHICPPKPDTYPIGTKIRCNECGTEWVKAWIVGWVRAEAQS